MKYLILTAVLALANVATAGITDMEMMHTKPVCNHQNIAPSWCTKDDMVEIGKQSGMIDRINAQIDLAVDPDKARIFVAYLSFSNKPIARKLCEKAKTGV